MHASLDQLREQIVDLLPRLRRFARTLARDPHDADDLVQIAVERALARSSQLREDARLSSWMFGILRNAWIDETRTRGRRNQIFAPEELVFDAKGFLIACEGADEGGRRLGRYDTKTGKSKTVVDNIKGKRFNAPNDLAIDLKGRIYFTDPRYLGDEPRELER